MPLDKLEKTIFATLRKLRKHLKFTQQQMATELGLSSRSIMYYERDRVPSLYELCQYGKLAARCGQEDLREIIKDVFLFRGGKLFLFPTSQEFIAPSVFPAEENYEVPVFYSSDVVISYFDRILSEMRESLLKPPERSDWPWPKPPQKG